MSPPVLTPPSTSERELNIEKNRAENYWFAIHRKICTHRQVERVWEYLRTFDEWLEDDLTRNPHLPYEDD